MPTSTFVQVTQGSGTKLHTATHVEGADTVHDEVVIPGEPYLASYVVGFAAISIATSADHVIQIMAGASLLVRIRHIFLCQTGLAGAVGNAAFVIHRLTTAGTGGTVITPRALDTADGAAGATTQTLPTTKGTEGNFYQRFSLGMFATAPITVLGWDWTQPLNSKAFVIPAGTANGMCIKISTGVASATVSGYVEFDESNF